MFEKPAPLRVTETFNYLRLINQIEFLINKVSYVISEECCILWLIRITVLFNKTSQGKVTSQITRVEYQKGHVVPSC